MLQVVLDCVLKKDIQYTKANPKFHHWNTDEKRFGLTFERCDDAKAFDSGVRNAVAKLNEGKKERVVIDGVESAASPLVWCAPGFCPGTCIVYVVLPASVRCHPCP